VNDKLVAARLEYSTLSREAVEYQDDLELALKIIGQACWIFERLAPRQQSKFLQMLARKIIVNLDGRIVGWELNAPFEYLSQLASGTALYQPGGNAPFGPRATVEQFSSLASFERRDRLQGLPESVMRQIE
jgi:hypothetical protein